MVGGGSDCARWYEKDTSKLLSVRESSLSIGASPYMGVSPLCSRDGMTPLLSLDCAGGEGGGGGEAGEAGEAGGEGWLANIRRADGGMHPTRGMEYLPPCNSFSSKPVIIRAGGGGGGNRGLVGGF